MKLVIEDESGTQSTIPFAGSPITVGRGEEGVSFRLADRNVSRRHARFTVANNAVFVEDLGSSNGTRVNGEKIRGRRRIRSGDLVQIGDYDLVLAEPGEARGAPPSASEEAATAAGPKPALRSRLRVTVLILVAVLLASAAAGWAVGMLTAPVPGAASSAGRP